LFRETEVDGARWYPCRRGRTCEATLVPDTIYRLSPQLVDFNTTKILSAIFELDLE
jgi:hypothetical protein